MQDVILSVLCHAKGELPVRFCLLSRCGRHFVSFCFVRLLYEDRWAHRVCMTATPSSLYLDFTYAFLFRRCFDFVFLSPILIFFFFVFADAAGSRFDVLIVARAAVYFVLPRLCYNIHGHIGGCAMGPDLARFFSFYSPFLFGVGTAHFYDRFCFFLFCGYSSVSDSLGWMSFPSASRRLRHFRV